MAGSRLVDPEVALFGPALELEDVDAASRHLTTLKALAVARSGQCDMDYLQIGELSRSTTSVRGPT